MEQRPEYIPVFQHVYEHLRLMYIRTTGDLDVTLSSIKDDISRGNVVLETQLEDAGRRWRSTSYRLVVYASSDEGDNDVCARSECISTTATEECVQVTGFTAAQGRYVMLDDYTSVVVEQSGDPDVELEIDIRPEDEEF